MRILIFPPFIIILLIFGCQSEHKKTYNKCMNSGIEELYGKTLAPDFCHCFSDAINSKESPFTASNRCAKPIIERMLNEEK